MKISYDRIVDHCKRSEYVKKVTIDRVYPADNSDKLDKVEFKENFYDAISQKNLYQAGDTVYWIPGDSILPNELADKLGVRSYLKKSVVRTIKVRGNRSEGLICPVDIAEKYIKYILKWESPPKSFLSSDYKNKNIIKNIAPPEFKTFYKMPNLLNSKNLFKPKDKITITEKIHGMNARFGYLKRPSMGIIMDLIYKILFYITKDPKYDEYQYYVGSHNSIIKKPTNKLSKIFWNCFNKYIKNNIKKDEIMYGEIYGPGIQKGFDYGLKEPSLVIFSIINAKTGEYINPKKQYMICKLRGIPTLEMTIMEFKDIEQLRKIASSKSSITDKHIREGIVIKSFNHGKKMAKLINFTYLERDVDKRSEFH